MTVHLSRRTLLGTVPTLAAPMALLPVSVARAAAETPIQRLFRKYLALEADLNENDHSEDNGGRLFDRLMDVERRIAAEPVTCLEDLAAKVLAISALSGKGDSPFDKGIREECEALAGGRVWQ